MDHCRPLMLDDPAHRGLRGRKIEFPACLGLTKALIHEPADSVMSLWKVEVLSLFPFASAMLTSGQVTLSGSVEYLQLYAVAS